MNDCILTNNDASPSQMSPPSTQVFNFLAFGCFLFTAKISKLWQNFAIL